VSYHTGSTAYRQVEKWCRQPFPAVPERTEKPSARAFVPVAFGFVQAGSICFVFKTVFDKPM